MVSSPIRSMPTPPVSQAFAEGASRAAIAPVPLQQPRIVLVSRATGERIHARMLHVPCFSRPHGGCRA